jgi:hypothetical protein
MKIKLLFDTIIINNNLVDPVYNAHLNIVLDRVSGEILYKFSNCEVSNFFNFGIEFSHYQYINIYIPKTKSYKNKIYKRVYNICLYLNLLRIINDNGMTKEHNRRLAYYLSILQIKEIKNKKNYYTNEKSIHQFIHYRKNNNMCIMPWYHFSLNSDYSFNLQNKKLISTKYVTKIFFKKIGGIIETNNVIKLINENFRDHDKKINTLIILPINMSNLWQNYHTMTYDELFYLKKSSMSNYKKIDRLIIHEFHIQFLVGIKNLINFLGCREIWIINSMPLRYYFSMERTPIKLKINELASITGLWLSLSIDEKKRYKNSIIKMLLTNFNQYYTIVNYETFTQKFRTIQLSMMPLEKHMYDLFNKYYNNWKNRLTNDSMNVYSITTKQKNSIIEAKIYNAIITLITSIIDLSYVPKFFEYNIKNVLFKIKNIRNMKNITDKIINNYNRYLSNISVNDSVIRNVVIKSNTIYSSFNDKYCPICYSDEDIIRTKLICGHFICLDCIIHTLGNTSRCPICNEFINIHKIAIIRNSIKNYDSNITTYLKTLDRNTVILTDMQAFNNLSINSEYKTHIININKTNVSDKIKKLTSIENIVVISTPDEIISDYAFNQIDKIINFFMLFNEKPKVTRIQIIY